jgi:sugar (pentulose or hexulose) kinase
VDQGCRVVLDVGKSFAKASLWSADGRLLDAASRPNSCNKTAISYRCLDADGIGAWYEKILGGYARAARIAAVIPVAHGAAACVIKDDGTWLPPMDYEAELPADIRAAYLKERDSFSLTGSPALPGGLNLGAQLFWLEKLMPEAFAQGTIVTWPQFWAWRLCGVAATDTTSLGCHTDLWLPAKNAFSPLAIRRGWADRLAPVHKPGDVLGTVTRKWQDRCGLPPDCRVLCGLHDSNAALLAMRGYPEVADREHTVLSTGTWFIAMHATLGKRAVSPAMLEEARDCLVNVDAFAAPVPSARFMGGRELEVMEAAPVEQMNGAANEEALQEAAAKVVKRGVFALPSFHPGVGPYPQSPGRWIDRPQDQLTRRAAADLYLALVTDTMLNLIGSRGPLIAEGRFAGDPLYIRALASLRREQSVFAAPPSNSVPYGALRLVAPDLPPSGALAAKEPLPFALDGYAARWRELAD